MKHEGSDSDRFRTVDGIVIGPGEGEQIPRGPRFHRVFAELPELEAFELRFGPDFEGVDPHTHSDHVDSFYILAGEAEFRVGEDVFRAGPGSFVAAPIGVVHGFWNVGGTELRIVNIHVPNTGFAVRLRAADRAG